MSPRVPLLLACVLLGAGSGRCATSHRPDIVRTQMGKSAVYTLILAGQGGDTLLFGSGDLKVWHKGEISTPLPPPAAPYVQSGGLALSPDGRLFARSASASGKATLEIWDLAQRTRLRVLGNDQTEGYRAVSFSPDGQLLAASYFNWVQIWRLSDGQLVQELPLSRHFTLSSIPSLVFSPDSQTLAAIYRSNIDPTHTYEGAEVSVWRVRDGALLATSTVAKTALLQAGASPFPPVALAFTEDGRAFVTSALATAADSVRIWSAADGSLLQEAPADFAQAGGPIVNLALSPNGRLLGLVSVDQVAVLSASDGRWLWSAPLDTWSSDDYASGRRVAFSPDGQVIAVGAASGMPPDPAAIRVVSPWRASDGAPLPSLVGYPPDRSRLNAPGPQFAGGPPGPRVFSPDGRMLVVFPGYLLDARDLSLIRPLLEGGRPPDEDATSFAFFPDGQRLVMGSGRDVLIDPDYPLTNSPDNVLRIWRVSDGRLLQAWGGHTGNVLAVAVSPDGRVVASGSGVQRYFDPVMYSEPALNHTDTDDTVWLRSADDGHPLHRLPSQGAEVVAVAFSHDGRLLASGSRDGVARLWRVNDGSLAQTISGQGAELASLGFSPDDERIGVGYRDNTTRIYRVADGQALQVLQETGEMSPDWKVLASFDGSTLRLSQVPDDHLLAVYDQETDGIFSFAFSPDSRQYAYTRSDDVTVLARTPQSPGPAGDVNGNGILDLGDALQSLRIAVGLGGADAAAEAAADVDGDGHVTLRDVILLLGEVVGLPA